MNRQERIAFLKAKAAELRETSLTMIHAANSGHPGGSLSAADIMAALYFHEMRLDPENPQWEDRDRFVLSKGHVCPVLYSALIMKGYMPDREIYNLRKFGSMLQGHPCMKKTPGVDISTGSLGQGISCAAGMAIGLKRLGKDSRVFCMIGDGETNEGQVWEAVQSAVKYELDNFIVFVDYNRLQVDGFCEDIMPLRSLPDKFKAFGCAVYEIDGHSMEEILDVLDTIRNSTDGRPKFVVASCIKGKGVSFMENEIDWHGTAPNDEQFKQAIAEIRAAV
ncbi:MAG: transketolase [Treponema sp.]|nr:transketolase [Treponema sp.]